MSNFSKTRFASLGSLYRANEFALTVAQFISSTYLSQYHHPIHLFNAMSYQLILNTCPDFTTAEQLATQIVANKLAACVNILPNLTSIYQWQGQVESAQEHLLLIKAPCDQYAAIESYIAEHHPYDVPEIIAFSIEKGSPEYLQWITSCTTLK